MGNYKNRFPFPDAWSVADSFRFDCHISDAVPAVVFALCVLYTVCEKRRAVLIPSLVLAHQVFALIPWNGCYCYCHVQMRKLRQKAIRPKLTGSRIGRSPTEAPDVRNVPGLPRPRACQGLLEAEATSGCHNSAVGKAHAVCHCIRGSFSRLGPANLLDDAFFFFSLAVK